ncbi:hypothetical protein BDQ12DRAFT_689699 [Crucibulum laeve]|uniref:VWFA domain-containing protein n=1 Tax=Crucibulum laeve TaxID=68775 RepID=A0A5C3M0H2_9AGAR|nr:hypothetical protein BDQ12DRAFT_689699 [Crucibulum laeve]
MSRPAITSQSGASVKFTIPPDWFISVSAISRKLYHQAIHVQTNIRNNATTFKSDYGTSGPMPDAASGNTTFPIAPRQTVVQIEILAYYAESSADLSARDMKVAKYASNKVDVHTSTKPDTASSDIPDYVTYFIFVEDTVEQVAGSGQFDDSVVTIHLVKTNPNAIPPPPPPNVIKPYNPVLDRPRPSKLENYLKQYDVVFLIDDSGSMQGDRWTEARNALDGLANYIIDNGWDSDGIDLRFLNSNDLFRFKGEVNGVQDKGKVAAAINKVTPNGNTPTGRRTSEILNAHVDRLDAAKGTNAYAEIKPLDLICITDGAPNDEDAYELTKMLVAAGNRIKGGAQPHHPNSMGVQFVQIGDDANAKVALQKLVQADTGNMVDTVPYAGPGTISPDKLERILLGGLHPNVRAQQTP